MGKNNFEALFKRNFKRKIASTEIEKICWQINIAALMQPLQYDLRCPAAKENSMQPRCQATLTQPLQCSLRRLSCKTQKNYAQQRRKLQLQNRVSTPKRQKDDFEALSKRNFKRKITSTEIEKICWQIDIAALMQPLQYDLRCPAAKENSNSITHAAAVPSNLDAAIIQCVLQYNVANLHISMHVATSDADNHAAIPMRHATADSRNA